MRLRWAQLEAHLSEHALSGRQDLPGELWWDEHGHVIEVGQHPNAARVKAASSSQLLQCLLQSFQTRREATSKEERRKRVALIHPTGCPKTVALASAVPEQVPGGAAAEELGAREEVWCHASELTQAGLPVHGAVCVFRIQRQQHELRVRLGQCPRSVRQDLRASRRANCELAGPERSSQLLFARTHQQAPG